jgi:hypothetical protein
VSIGGQRLIVDTSLGSPPLADTRFSFEVDQSLRENLLLIVNAAIARQSYFSLSNVRNSRQIQVTCAIRRHDGWVFRQKSVTDIPNRDLRILDQSIRACFGLSVTARR